MESTLAGKARLLFSLTNAAAVVNPTLNPFWQAARPSASATWVLPVPLLPRAMMFSRRRMYSQRANSRTSILLSPGMAMKSNVSKFFTTGNRAARMRRSTVRRSRSISSSSISRSR